MVNIIAAVAFNNVIGKNNDIPWYISEDLKHFKKLTLGHVVVMGRKTFDSIMARLGKPLPGRTNIVITRQEGLMVPPGVEVFHDIDAALLSHSDETVFVIGGSELYRQTMDRCEYLYITRIKKNVEGDAFFPEIKSVKWKCLEVEDHGDFEFQVYRIAERE